MPTLEQLKFDLANIKSAIVTIEARWTIADCDTLRNLNRAKKNTEQLISERVKWLESIALTL